MFVFIPFSQSEILVLIQEICVIRVIQTQDRESMSKNLHLIEMTAH